MSGVTACDKFCGNGGVMLEMNLFFNNLHPSLCFVGSLQMGVISSIAFLLLTWHHFSVLCADQAFNVKYIIFMLVLLYLISKHSRLFWSFWFSHIDNRHRLMFIAYLFLFQKFVFCLGKSLYITNCRKLQARDDGSLPAQCMHR